MKYLSYIFLLLIISCNVPQKKVTNAPVKKEQNISEINNKLVVVVKNSSNLNDVKALIQNSGLFWNETSYKTDVTNIGIIEVPVEKIDFWKKQLSKSNEFTVIEKYSTELLTKLINKEKNTLLQLSKTPCFGDCPVYSLIIDRKGNAEFTGTNYVLKKGLQKFSLSRKELEKLNNLLEKTDFSSFKKIYDNPKISDLPSTFISHNGKQIKIRLWNNIPDALIEIHEYVESILLEKKFYN